MTLIDMHGARIATTDRDFTRFTGLEILDQVAAEQTRGAS